MLNLHEVCYVIQQRSALGKFSVGFTFYVLRELKTNIIVL